jgi:hypothetical protein
LSIVIVSGSARNLRLSGVRDVIDAHSLQGWNDNQLFPGSA